MLNTIHLRTFLAVVDAGNYTAAADQLHMSQPAVSQHIRSLEEQLGSIRLFRRVGQRMVPTHAGEELLQGARDLLVSSERLEQSIRALKGQVTGHIVIGCTPGSGANLLPPLLALFLMQFPEVTLEVQVSTSDLLLEALAMQHMSLLVLEEQQRRRGWESRFLGYEDLQLLAPPDHPLVQHTQQPHALLHEHALVMPESGTPLRRTIEDGLRRRGVTTSNLHVVIETNSVPLMLQCIHHSIGVAFVPTISIPQVCSLKTIALEGMPMQQEWHILRTRDRSAARAVQELYMFFTSPTARTLLAKCGLHDHVEE